MKCGSKSMMVVQTGEKLRMLLDLQLFSLEGRCIKWHEGEGWRENRQVATTRNRVVRGSNARVQIDDCHLLDGDFTHV